MNNNDDNNNNNNNNTFGKNGAGENIWIMDVHGIVEDVIKNRRYSNNINDNNRVVVQSKYRFVDIMVIQLLV